MNTTNYVKFLVKPLTKSYSTENLISESQYNKKIRQLKVAALIISLAAILISTAGIVAVSLTGCLPLIALPVATMLLSIVLLKVVYRLRPRISPVPIGFSNLDPDDLFTENETARSADEI